MGPSKAQEREVVQAFGRFSVKCLDGEVDRGVDRGVGFGDEPRPTRTESSVRIQTEDLMSQHEKPERKLGDLPVFVPQKLRVETAHVESFDLPREWVDEERLREGARVFVGRADSSLEERILHAGEAARAHTGGFAIAVVGVRFVILREGRVLQTARNPTSSTLGVAMRAGLEVEAEKVVLAASRLVVEEALDYDSLRESSELQTRSGDGYVGSLLEARRMLLCGIARSHGPILLQLVEDELEAIGQSWRAGKSSGSLQLHDQNRRAETVRLVVKACQCEHEKHGRGCTRAQVGTVSTMFGPFQVCAECAAERCMIPSLPMAPGRIEPILAPARLPGDLCRDCGNRAEECFCADPRVDLVRQAVELYAKGVPHADAEGAVTLIGEIVSENELVSARGAAALREQLEQRGPEVRS